MPASPPRTKRSRCDTWLLGTWQSNREKTLEHWAFPAGRRGAELRRVLTSTFGLLTFRFTRSRVHTRFDEPAWTSRSYKILWRNAESVFLVYGPRSQREGQLIHFLAENEFWIHCGKGIEFFARQP